MIAAPSTKTGVHAKTNYPSVARLVVLILALSTTAMLFACTAESQDQAETESQDQQAEQHQVFPSDEIEWGSPPPSFEPGAEMAILEGDPSAEGEVYTLRLRLPPDYFIAPHTHPLPERAMVLSGTLYLGHDDEMDKESAERLEPGAYFTLPPEMVHYVISDSEEETILHITSVGPLELNYVDEEDDPRLRSE